MDFQGLKQGNSIYIIDRSDKPKLVVADVTNVSAPRAPITNQLAAIGTNITQVVDITAKVGEQVTLLNNLTANAESETYNQGAQFVAASQGAALREVDRMIADSKAALAKVDYHQAVVTEGEKMLELLNPQYKEAKAQKQDIADLKAQVVGITDKFDQMMQMMTEMQESLKSSKSK